MKQKRIFSLFTRSQLEELKFFLNRNKIPLKFEYFAKGADSWKELVSSNEYGIGDVELNLLRQSSKNILKKFRRGYVNILDLGCGDGCKALPIISILQNKCRYFPFDISKRMLEIATKNVSKKFPGLRVEGIMGDFEKDNFYIADFIRDKYRSNNLILFLGNTVGNPFNMEKVLINIKKNMTTGDYLLIGTEIVDNKDISDILKHYQNKNIYNIQFSCLSALGVKESSGHFRVLFNKNKRQVETRFIFGEDVQIKIENKKFFYKKGDNILLMVSRKFRQQEIRKLLESNGFLIDFCSLDRKEGYILILCRALNV